MEVRARPTALTWVLAGIARAVARLPWASLAWLGAALGALAFLARIRRAHVEHAMARAGIDRPACASAAMYRSLGTGVFELLWLAGQPEAATGRSAPPSPKSAADPEIIVSMLTNFRGPRAVAELAPSAVTALAQVAAGGRGAVVAATHTGNWDLAACALAASGPLVVVTKRLSVGGIDAFWQRARARAGVTLVEARGALSEARVALGRGALVAMMIDQVPGSRRAVPVSFLGAPALADRAPAALALRAGVPLVVAAQERTADGRHRVHALLVLTPPPRATRADASGWIDAATAQASAALELFVRERPSQWLWMHRRWRAISTPCTTPSSSPARASAAASS